MRGARLYTPNMSISAKSFQVSGVLSPANASKLIEADKAAIVDVRETDEYRREHVAGAALFPTSIFSPASFPPARPDKSTLILCGSGQRATRVASAMRATGRDDIIVVDGGLRAWKAAGLPVVVNAAAAIPMMRQVMIAAGILVIGFTALAGLVNTWFLIGTGFVGAGMLFAGVTGLCAMATVLSKMPWNRAAKQGEACSTKNL